MLSANLCAEEKPCVLINLVEFSPLLRWDFIFFNSMFITNVRIRLG